MKRTMLYCAWTLLVTVLIAGGAQAATVNTTLQINANGSLSSTSVAVTGTATLGGGIGSGAFSATVNLTAIGASGISAPFTITFSNGDRINGTLSIPATALGTGSATGVTATITGGTGAYNGATGSFSNFNGTASVAASITLAFTGSGSITTSGSGGGGGPATNTPVITDVLDAGSYTKNIAQGSIFVVKGSNLSAAGYTAMSFPLPTTSSNVKITFTRLGTTSGTDAYLVYLYNQSGVNQLAGVLPSSLTTGSYNVTVTNGSNGSSAPSAVRVVDRKLGLTTADSSGSGLAVIQNYVSASQLDIDRFTTFSSGGYTFSPSKPGQVLIAWGTGMGPVSGGDNTASPGFDFGANGVNVQVIVGNKTIKPLYAGRAPGLAGADQINFQLPPDVQTGCVVPFQVSVNGQLSNPSFIAIADAGSNACSQQGFTADQLSRFDSGATYTTGGFSITQFQANVPSLGNAKINAAGGSFVKYTGFQLAGLANYQSQITNSGACTVIHSSGSASAIVSGSGLGLDAGNVTLSGPSGSGLANTAFTKDPASYAYSMNLGFEGGGFSVPGTINATLLAGTYTINGAGGNDVNSFSASVQLGAPLTITGGLPSTVNRSSDLRLNWTGGNAGDLVTIIGASSTTTGTATNRTTDTWEFVCTTNAGAGGFTVPSSVLTQLPPVSAAAISNGSGSGLLEVVSGAVATFNAPLKAGGSIDKAAFTGMVGTGAFPAYQ
jgi:uncharacterized protein (TIGR03437 family)